MSVTRLVRVDDAPVLAELAHLNREFLAPWEPAREQDYFTVERQRALVAEALARYQRGSAVPRVIVDGSGRIVGRITLNDIVRGTFQSAHLGYWVGAADNGRGLATAAVRETVGLAFGDLGLHRVEAATLLHNNRSRRVLEHTGFSRVGIAPAYLNIAGKWQDHVLYQRVSEDSQPSGGLTVPVLEAGPFRLRAFRFSDVQVVREAAADPLIPLITTVPAAFTREGGIRFIERQWSRAEHGTGYSFAIADAVTDRAVGQIGLWLKDINEGRASVGYWVAASGRGRGAAAFALAELARWAHHELHIPRLELYVEPWNEGSIRSAQRAGFQREGILRSWQEVGGQRKDMVMYARLASDPPIPAV